MTETLDEPEITTEQVAAAEAEEAQEAEQDAEELEAAPEPEAPQEAAQEPAGLSESDIDKRIKSLEKEATRHANRLSEIMGDDAQSLEPCPRCAGPFVGFIFPPEQAPPPPEQVALVKASIGEAPPQEFKPASNARRCDECDGLGMRDSGSLVPQYSVLACDRCSGYGYISVGGPPAAAPPGNGDGPTTPPAAAEPAPDTDPWGRRPGDANYGVMPGYERRQPVDAPVDMSARRCRYCGERFTAPEGTHPPGCSACCPTIE